jgi:hypothetical protein
MTSRSSGAYCHGQFGQRSKLAACPLLAFAFLIKLFAVRTRRHQNSSPLEQLGVRAGVVPEFGDSIPPLDTNKSVSCEPVQVLFAWQRGPARGGGGKRLPVLHAKMCQRGAPAVR